MLEKCKTCKYVENGFLIKEIPQWWKCKHPSNTFIFCEHETGRFGDCGSEYTNYEEKKVLFRLPKVKIKWR